MSATAKIWIQAEEIDGSVTEYCYEIRHSVALSGRGLMALLDEWLKSQRSMTEPLITGGRLEQKQYGER